MNILNNIISTVLKEEVYKPGINFNDADAMSYFRYIGDKRYLIILNFGNKYILLSNVPDNAQLIISTNPKHKNFKSSQLDPKKKGGGYLTSIKYN